MRRFRKPLQVFLFVYILITIMLYSLQEKMIFLPSKLPQDYRYSFRHDFEEINLETEDGFVLNSLHFKQVKSKGLILYFHGNAGDLSRWGNITAFFVDKNYDVLVMDYRTYGKSTGKLSEEALHNDAQMFYDYALKHYDETDIILYGRSLGTGIATRLAANNNPNRLLLETPFYSLMDIAKERFPFLPIKWLMKYKFMSHEFIQKVTCPIAIFHGTRDRVIPYESGKRLFKAIPHEAKEFFTINEGGHNNLIEFDNYKKGINKALQ